jgi:hypothetical protein
VSAAVLLTWGAAEAYSRIARNRRIMYRWTRETELSHSYLTVI